MNQKTIKVSIIIPVYKVEMYLRNCLDSVVAQTYKNIEVILIDDGSPDNCGIICDEYAKKYTYIQVIHQKNQGQSAARNHAMQIARGDFFFFIDADDFVETDCVEYLVALQQKFDADIVIGKFKYLYEGKTIKPRNNKELIVVMNAEDALIRMNYLNGFGATACPKLFRRNLILIHPFPIGQIYEDFAVMYKIVGDANTIVYSNRRIYYWLQREGSTMHKAFDESQMAGIEAAKSQLVYLKEKYPNAVPAAKARYVGKIVEIMPLALKNNSKIVYNRLKNQMNFYQEVLFDKNVKNSLKIRMLSIKCGYYPTKLIFCLHDFLKRLIL